MYMRTGEWAYIRMNERVFTQIGERVCMGTGEQMYIRGGVYKAGESGCVWEDG